LIMYEFPPKTHIMEPWLYSQDLVLVHASRGIGKTYFLIGLTMALATGTEFLGWQGAEPVKVLYVDGEMPGVSLQKRFAEVIEAIPGSVSIGAMPKIVTPDIQGRPLRSLSTSEGRSDLLEVITDDVNVVILDNLACLYGGNENDAEAWDAMQAFLLLLRTRGIAVILVHHSGKSGQQRGTSHREDILDTVIQLRKPGDYNPADGARFEIHFEKSRNIEGHAVPQIEARLDRINGGLAFTWQTISDSIMQQIVTLYNEGMTQRDIAEEVGINKSNVNRRIKELRKANILDAK